MKNYVKYCLVCMFPNGELLKCILIIIIILWSCNGNYVEVNWRVKKSLKKSLKYATLLNIDEKLFIWASGLSLNNPLEYVHPKLCVWNGKYVTLSVDNGDGNVNVDERRKKWIQSIQIACGCVYRWSVWSINVMYSDEFLDLSMLPSWLQLNCLPINWIRHNTK